MKTILSVLFVGTCFLAIAAVANGEPASGVIQLAANGSGSQASTSGGGDGASGTTNNSTDITKLFTGGFIVSSTLGTQRVSSIKYITRDDGTVFAQVSNNPGVQYGGALTFGFISPNNNIHTTKPKSWLSYPGDAIMCGPFAFLPSGKNGCGPIFVGALSSGSSSAIGQVGAGWAMDAIEVQGKKIAISFGALVNPTDTVLDDKVIDPQTRLVRTDYLTAAKNGALSGTTTKATAGLFGMISLEF